MWNDKLVADLLRQVAWLPKLSVNPVLNSVGCDTHKPRARLPRRNGIPDLKLPFP
jgi:hypothetical protein